MGFTSDHGLVYEPNFTTYTIVAGVLSVADSYVGTLDWYYYYTYENPSDTPASTSAGMSYLEMQTAVEHELGVISAGIINKLPADFIKDKLNFAQREVAKRLLCILDDTTFNTVASTEQYNLSSYFIEGSVTRVTYDGNPLVEVAQSYRNNYASTDTGTPSCYYLRGRVIGLLPKPDAIKSTVVEHALWPTNMTDNTDISQCPEIAHRAIILLTAFYCLDYMDDSKAADKWNDYQDSIRENGNMLNRNKEVEIENVHGW